MKKLIIGLLVMISIGICNNISKELLDEYTEKLISYYCDKLSTKKVKIEPALVKAIVKQETQGKPYSHRFEKHMQTNKYYNNHIPKKYKKNKLSYCSMGIMQVMYGTARWMGFRKEPEDLFMIKNSLKYGIKYLRYLIKRYNNIEKVVSAYNGGSVRYAKTGKAKGKLFNYYTYVKPVLINYTNFKGKINVKPLIKK